MRFGCSSSYTWSMLKLLLVTAGGRVFSFQELKLAPSDTSLPFVLCRTHFPLRLAYSMTINKAQGQTFDKFSIYLPDPLFSHGQLYVAFSRARSLQSISVKIGQISLQGSFGNNYVIKTLFSRKCYKWICHGVYSDIRQRIYDMQENILNLPRQFT